MNLRRLATSVLLGLGVFACSGVHKRFDTVDQAGSFGIAVLSIEDWSSFKAEGQPKFTMTPELSLSEVLPNTAVTEEQLIRTIAMLLKAALPTATTTKTALSTSQTTSHTDSQKADAGGTTTDTADGSTSQTETKPGDVSKVGTNSKPPTSTGTVTPASALGTSPGTDTHLKYLAATALYQYVKVLNHYVTNAVSREGYRSVLATLQVSLLPKVRNAPYDAYSSVMFWPVTAGTAPQDQRAQQSQQDQEQGLVHVVPLLNTDNLEAELISRSDAKVVELALGILASIQGIGLSADASSKMEELRKTVGHNYNSLLSISRLGDNLLRVRMGAQLQGGIYSMVPRTHTVPVLLLVPCDVKYVRLMSRVDFVDAERGTTLELRDANEASALIHAALASNGVSCQEGRTSMDLYGYASMGRVSKFQQTLSSGCAGAGNNVEQIALDLLHTRAGSAYASASFQMPDVEMPNLASTKATSLIDDGKISRLRIAGVSGLKASNASFWLTTDNLHSLFPDSTSVSDNGTAVEFEFPSAAQLGFADSTKWTIHGEARTRRCEIPVGNGSPTSPETDPRLSSSTTLDMGIAYLRVKESKSAPDAPAVITLAVGSSVIKPNADNKAKLGVKISRASKGLKDPIVLKFAFKRGSAPAAGLVQSATTPPGYTVVCSPLNLVTVTSTDNTLSAEIELTLDQLQTGTEMEVTVQSGSLPVSAPRTITIST